METEAAVYDDSRKELDSIQEKLEDTREKMELEALAFIEATKKFTSEWIKREVEISVNSPETAAFPENLRLYNKNSGESNLDLKELSLKISGIVETYLNHEDYWIHKNALFQPDISRDYIEYKKEKILKELTSNVRKILGCATEILWEEGEPENKAWVKEMGKRKYVCFLRFSDEMTASLNHYFELLEELLILNHKIKEEILWMERQKA
ncbi:MAG TPA: hypothetical protein HA262_11965 [Methanosarcina sp.]|jgi:hypothetical protein|nr:hypothetical protein [Methanosarcina sp.]